MYGNPAHAAPTAVGDGLPEAASITTTCSSLTVAARRDIALMAAAVDGGTLCVTRDGPQEQGRRRTPLAFLATEGAFAAAPLRTAAAISARRPCTARAPDASLKAPSEGTTAPPVASDVGHADS